METSILGFAKKLMEVNHIHVTEINLPFDESMESFDLGFRKYLFDRFDFQMLFKHMLESYEAQTLYYIKDIYQCHYAVMRLPLEDTTLLLAGPFLYDRMDDISFLNLAPQMKFPPEKYGEIKKYYQGLPIASNDSILFNFFSVLASEIYGGDDKYSVIHSEQTMEATGCYEDYSDKEELPFFIKEVEKRWEIMDKLLHEVQRGNAGNAVKYLAQFHAMSAQPRFTNRLRDIKNWLIIFNTSLRNTAYQAQIHPFYVDEISTKFSLKIDALTTADSKLRIMQEMVHQYCMLINNHYTAGYSPMIQKAILYISLHLTLDLSLKAIANELSVNASYLSKLFKQEMGVTLTDYVNQKRIRESLNYLNSSNVRVKNIIHLVGIYDLNYYTKLFKKYIGMTPTEYCQLIGNDKRQQKIEC